MALESVVTNAQQTARKGKNKMPINDKITRIINENYNSRKVEINQFTDFDDLQMDSLDRVEFVMTLEEEFGIDIEDQDAEKFTTVGQAVAYVTRKIDN